jgi:beta-lactamase superfamily II metal-dependent hydrolase
MCNLLKNALKLFFVLVFCWLNVAFCTTLEVCFFDTGQGNCVALRTRNKTSAAEDRLLFIDCGHGFGWNHSKFKTPSEQMNVKLKTLMLDVPQCNILVTHNHDDHKNLVNTIKEVATALNKMPNFIRQFPPPRTKNLETNEATISDNYPTKDQVYDLLGSSVDIIQITPDTWQNHHAQSPEHDYNAVYKVKFAGRNLLFTGDVSPQLFSELMADPKYKYELKDVDFFVLPHHGSNRAGEVSASYSSSPELCMICSDPQTNQNLPWDITRRLLFDEGPKPDTTVMNHQVSTNAGLFENHAMPLFITCNSGSYYKLLIEDNGEAHLYTDVRNIGNTFTQHEWFSSTFTPNKAYSRLNFEIKQLSMLREAIQRGDLNACQLITPGRLQICSVDNNGVAFNELANIVLIAAQSAPARLMTLYNNAKKILQNTKANWWNKFIEKIASNITDPKTMNSMRAIIIDIISLFTQMSKATMLKPIVEKIKLFAATDVELKELITKSGL